jgi:putative transposase
MLTQDQFSQYCACLGLSEAARSVIDHIRASPPVRRVRSSAKSVAVRYPSRKMGVVIQAESHRNELAFVYEMEYEEEVLEYYDQPSTFKLEYQAKSGRPVGVLHTPDFFVLRTGTAGWEECKTEADLETLAEQMPHRYVRDDAIGQWRCPPGERYAEQYGLYYHVRSSAEINWVFQRNFIFLQDYLRDDYPEVAEAPLTEIRQRVVSEPGLKLDQLLACLQAATGDDLYRLIATGQIYADLCTMPLAEPDRVRLFGDVWTAQAFIVLPETITTERAGGFQSVAVEINASLQWDGRPWTIVNIGETDIWLRSAEQHIVRLSPTEFKVLLDKGALVGSQERSSDMSTEVRQLLAQANPEDLKVANQRYQIIKPVLAGEAPPDGSTPKRTIYAWVSRYRQAQRLHQYGFVGLLPRWHQCGNHTPRLPQSTQELLDTFVTDNYETLKHQFMYEVYAELLLACERQGILAPSYKTFANAVHKRPPDQQTQKREGRRRAYDLKVFYWELELTTPRHGDRPFEIGHLDHTQLDIELIHSTTGSNLGRPWATFLSDAFSRRLLAVYLTFESPSYRSCMMALRECVRLHQRLPQCLVVDGGPEFGSIYFETLMAFYECAKKTRPPSQGRFGSVCERLFGTTNTRFIYNLLGNTQNMRHARQVTQSVDPKNLAQWTLPSLYLRLREWAYEVYDTIEHPALGQTPRAAFANGLEQSGWRLHRRIAYDEDFRLHTLPTTQTGRAKVNANRGVKMNYIYYWANDFRQPEVASTSVPVRYDPFDAGIAYAFVQRQWIQCISEHYARLRGRSEFEIKLATTELRARAQRHGQQLVVTARHIADFLDSLQQEEAAGGPSTPLLNAAEGKQVLALIDANPKLQSEAGCLAPAEPTQAVEPAPEQPTAHDEPLMFLRDYQV